MVPSPSALSSTIRARHTCFCGLFLDPITASSRSARTKPDFNAFSHPHKLAHLQACGNHSLASIH
jgi:hypothetical protein